MARFPAPRSILVADNAQTHHANNDLQDTCDAAGVLLVFLPEYCPQWNPCENVFSQAKAFLRRNGANYYEAYGKSSQNDWDLLQFAYDDVTPDDCQHYVSHCEY